MWQMQLILLVPNVAIICINACNDPMPHRRNVTQYKCVGQFPPFLLYRPCKVANIVNLMVSLCFAAQLIPYVLNGDPVKPRAMA